MQVPGRDIQPLGFSRGATFPGELNNSSAEDAAEFEKLADAKLGLPREGLGGLGGRRVSRWVVY